MSIEIVLHQPLIPQNTGSIARLTAANKLKLVLIEPLGFELSDKYLKRAGLDYWKYVNLEIYPSFDEYIKNNKIEKSRISILTTKTNRSLYDKNFTSNDILVFGNESSGLPEMFHTEYSEQAYRIPMIEEGVRSLNLANSVGIATFEALRQISYFR